ncbi:MAG: winged helix-turn-helix transcriptional regulator [Pseudomonadota bacterium]
MANAADFLGDRWMLLVLRSALYGVSRFEDILAELKIGRSVLSARLTRLVDAGLLERVTYREESDRSRAEYKPTQAARELLLVFAAMQQWGDKWVRRKAPAICPCKRSSGEALRVAFATAGGEIVAPDDVTMQPAERR